MRATLIVLGVFVAAGFLFGFGTVIAVVILVPLFCAFLVRPQHGRASRSRRHAQTSATRTRHRQPRR